jgi:hypothetical protein
MSLQSKSKHAEIRQLLILEWIKTNKLTMQWQPTTEMCADIGTKNLAVAQFTKLRDFITGYHFAQVVLKQRVSTDGKVSNTIMSFLCRQGGHGERAGIEETAQRRRAGRVDYWQGDHHATAGSKERVEQWWIAHSNCA